MRLLAVVAAVAFAAACGGNAPSPSAVSITGESVVPPPKPPVRLSIVFGGDVMQHMPQIEAARRDSAYDYTETFAHLKPFLDTADLAIVNLETTLSTQRYSGYPLFAAPAELASALRDCGIDAVTLANNHMLDKGRRGVLSTISALDSAGVRHTGVFADSAHFRSSNPLMLEAAGVKIALLSYTYGLNGMPVTEGTIVNRLDTVRMAADIAAAGERGAQIRIACLHWGYEYHRQPNAAQKELARWCRDKGVDLVIGCHPHVVQPIEAHCDSSGVMRGLTAYSLGNLVSNQRKRHRDGGIMLRVDVTIADSLPPSFEASYLPVWVHMPVEQERRRYIALPSPVADTMLREEAAATAYATFLADTRELLAGGPAREIKYVEKMAVRPSDIESVVRPVSRRPEE